jgi:Uma2 family endonuclease
MNVSSPPVRHRHSVSEFQQMAQAGILAEDDRLELIDGDLIDMTPIGSRHAGAVSRLTRLFGAAVGADVIVSVQNPVQLDRYSQPQPDLALLRPRADFYAHAHPQPADVMLIVEVAEASLDYDRDMKVPLYARHGIPEVWLLDVAGRCMTVFRAPGSDGYGEQRRIVSAESIAPVLLPAVVIDLAGLF